MGNKELLDLPIEMPEDDGSEPKIVQPDEPKPGEEPGIALDPSIIASSKTPDEIRAELEGLRNEQGKVVDDPRWVKRASISPALRKGGIGFVVKPVGGEVADKDEENQK